MFASKISESKRAFEQACNFPEHGQKQPNLLICDPDPRWRLGLRWQPKVRFLQLFLLPPLTEGFTARHKTTTTKRGCVSVPGVAAQVIYTAVCDHLGRPFGGNCALDEDELT